MHLLQFTTVKLSICLIFGILTSYTLQLSVELSLIVTIVLLVLLGLEHRFGRKAHSLRFGLLVVLLTMAIGNLSTALDRSAHDPRHYTHFLTSKDQVFILKIGEVLKSNDFSHRYIAYIKSVDTLTASGKILLSITKDTLADQYEVDDEIIALTTLAPIKSALNPYQFDYKKYMSNMGIDHQANITAHNYLIKGDPATSLYGIAAKMRSQIIKKLKQEAFGEAELGIIQALLLGQRNDISEDTNSDYKNAGAFHILSLSGLHIGIILGLLHLLFRPLEALPRGRSIKLVLIVLLLWGFAFLAGLSASILRAVGMFTFVAYALYLNRPTGHYNILALSLFFILLAFSPLLLFDVGFQLSYVAVFAIVWFYPHLKKYWIPKNWVLQKGWEIIAVSIAAQLGVLPIVLFYFHHFPSLFVLTSLLILPPMAFILGLGILVIFLTLIGNLPSFLVVLYDLVIRWMNSIIAWVAQQESFVFKNISFDAVQSILLYGIIISLRSMLVQVSYKKIIWFLAFIMGLQLWGLARKYQITGNEALFIGHNGRNSVLVHRAGHKITAYTNNPFAAERLVTDYATALYIDNLTNKPLKNSYVLGEERIIVMDSSLLSLPITSGAFTLLLTQSPKINLERLLDSVRPKIIIADGTNYRSYIGRWEATCIKKGIPFHYTGDKGAYIFKMP